MATEDLAGPILPQPTRELIKEIPLGKRHTGLQLDKLSFAAKQEDQKNALEEVTQTSGGQELFQTLCDAMRSP